mmetsp:Transcript_56595/g.143239  ORF Transcript_56595/g.143239 Transcript_56595/m.143239 type:complete len:295 (-) Transcript_56595:60-944(-)
MVPDPGLLLADAADGPPGAGDEVVDGDQDHDHLDNVGHNGGVLRVQEVVDYRKQTLEFQEPEDAHRADEAQGAEHLHGAARAAVGAGDAHDREDPIRNDNDEVDNAPRLQVVDEDFGGNHHDDPLLDEAHGQGGADVQGPEHEGDPVCDLREGVLGRVEDLHGYDDEIPQDEEGPREIPCHPARRVGKADEATEGALVDLLRHLAGLRLIGLQSHLCRDRGQGGGAALPPWHAILRRPILAQRVPRKRTVLATHEGLGHRLRAGGPVLHRRRPTGPLAVGTGPSVDFDDLALVA